MLRRITWRFWLLVLALVAGWVVAGAFYDDNPRVTGDLNQAAWLALFIAPMLVLVVTSITQHWWENDLGVSLAFQLVGLLPLAGVLAWVFFFDQGHITTGTQAWAFIGSPLWLSGWLLFRSWLYVRISREAKGERGDDLHPGQVTGSKR